MKRGLGISSQQGYTRELIRIVLELAPVVALQEGAERERNVGIFPYLYTTTQANLDTSFESSKTLLLYLYRYQI